jgi:hypothetical protein
MEVAFQILSSFRLSFSEGPEPLHHPSKVSAALLKASVRPVPVDVQEVVDTTVLLEDNNNKMTAHAIKIGDKLHLERRPVIQVVTLFGD